MSAAADTGTDKSSGSHDITPCDITSFRRVAAELGVDITPSSNRRLEFLEVQACSDEDEENLGPGMDFSGGGGTKQALLWCFGGFMVANLCAVLLFVTGTWQTPDGHIAIQQFYAGYLIELTLSLDNLFAFYLIFKYFRLRSQASMHRVLFWGVLGAIVLRAAVVAAGVALIQQSDCVLFLAAIVLLWTAWKVYHGEDDDDDDLENNSIVRCVSRILPVADEYCSDNFFVKQENVGWQATPLLLVLIIVELSDIAFAMDSVPAAFGITTDGVIVWSSSMCAILCLRSLYTLVVRFVAQLEYMSQAIGIVLLFIGLKLLCKVMFHVEFPVSLSLAIVVLILSAGAAFSVFKQQQESKGDASQLNENAAVL